MSDCKRRLAAAKKVYVDLATKPEQARLMVFDVKTIKWSAARVKAREQLVRALKNAEVTTGDIFDSEVARILGLPYHVGPSS